jgi:diphthine-ammonia ligase
MNSLEGRSFFCSWSGGKDGCLALYRAVQQGGRPRCLLTMLREDGQRSRSHGLPVPLLRRQAAALGIPLVTRCASWDGYEAAFSAALGEFRQTGIEAGVFGDIDGQPHREWVERVCGSAGVQPCEPLWQGARRALLDEFLDAGFRAILVTVRDGALDRSLLGRALDRELADELDRAGVDVCGENGEYHTLVTAGPLFSAPLSVTLGPPVRHDSCWFLDVR